MTERRDIPPLLRGLRRDHYRLGAIDVPWKYVVRSHKGLGRSADKKYRTMTLDEIAALPVGDYMARDSRILFWVTGPFFAAGAHLPIMRAWGFEPTSTWGVWIKPVLSRWRQGSLFLDEQTYFRMGMGYTSRQNAEFVVEGRRGKPPARLSKKVRQVIVEPAREHSRKPEGFYQRAEEYAAGPRLELFARQRRPGWTCRGDEVDKF